MSSIEEISAEHQDEFVHWPKNRQMDHLLNTNHTSGIQPRVGSLAAAQIQAMPRRERPLYHDRLHEIMANDTQYPYGYVEVGGDRVALSSDGTLQRPLPVKGGETLNLVYYPPDDEGSTLRFTEGMRSNLRFTPDMQVDVVTGEVRCHSEVNTWDERIIRCEKPEGHLKKHGFRIKWEDADLDDE